jgi:hypothetical protein
MELRSVTISKRLRGINHLGQRKKASVPVAGEPSIPLCRDISQNSEWIAFHFVIRENRLPVSD